MKPPSPSIPVALTIAGSDSGGNAGIQADLRSFHALGVHGCTAFAALTAQNPSGVRGILPVPGDFLRLQLSAIFDAYAVDAVKTGMLADSETIATVADALSAHPGIPLVADPVMVATSGAKLLRDDAIDTLARTLLPRAALITPNQPEAEVLAGFHVRGIESARRAARELTARYGCATLVKGGHDPVDPTRDVLCIGGRVWELVSPVVDAPLSTHGTGCTLSSAIAAALARGMPLLEAVALGKACIYEALRTCVWVGPDAAVLGLPRSLPRDLVEIHPL
ncbi:MAG: bifunctional hydroxymethylpyrimidine kinase/phosphomethylpyrimidine kinase [Kiritimatiellia bacterium]|jgi:hydroxymethylpyrimidine kinase/phosphomethylpyrimidine kinase